MKVRMRGRRLTISIAVVDPPTPSRSGKRLLVATSHGFRRTRLRIQGKPVAVSVNACIRADEWPDKKKSENPKSKELPKSHTKS